ncbi:hypothetical protein K469DRAFT_393025 [Zopfia rhizophila CBS 207.26]|uniref:Uncharacterized protein n=1 Tax=Zopfia rhizophila CBS 207.26 TaxID=1314779 RepID=A0A6A6EJE4_9PEZI|nr:hypothetical protein K469DRAFT_393025 [Zopfia rhizophila CBS 207.26]
MEQWRGHGTGTAFQIYFQVSRRPKTSIQYSGAAIVRDRGDPGGYLLKGAFWYLIPGALAVSPACFNIIVSKPYLVVPVLWFSELLHADLSQMHPSALCWANMRQMRVSIGSVGPWRRSGKRNLLAWSCHRQMAHGEPLQGISICPWLSRMLRSGLEVRANSAVNDVPSGPRSSPAATILGYAGARPSKAHLSTTPLKALACR